MTITALVLLDLQLGLCTGSAPLAQVVAERGILDAAASALEHARREGMPIAHVRLAFDERFGNRTNRTPRFDEHDASRRFIAGSESTRICSEVAPRADELLFSKGSVAPFASTPFESALRLRGISRLVLAGVATHLAIESTAREAADRGFSVAILEDACAAPTQELHRAAITTTLPLFAEVVHTHDFMSGVA